MKKILHNIDDLVQLGLLEEEERIMLNAVVERYPVRITDIIAQKIQEGSEGLKQQFMPSQKELNQTDWEREDPIGDNAFSPVKGLVHRYPDRVLLKLTHLCAVYCRFCFRREIIGQKGSGFLTQNEIRDVLSYISKHSEIWEVVFSGGDPLFIAPHRLKPVLDQLKTIEHVKILRFHTRIPVVSPDLISKDLINLLKSSEKSIYIVLHANHPDELTNEARDACSRLIDSGIIMLSQSVLLKGVNDNLETLSTLMKTFIECRIKPYYLHHLDPAPGVEHFRLSLEEGRQMISQLRGNISGLCQPHYMLDIPGGYGKASVAASAAHYNEEKNEWNIEDYKGYQHSYFL